jgi:acyl-CoA carboxylase subunit beta
VPVLATEVAPSREPYQRARRRMESLLTEIQELDSKVAQGGSPASVQRHRNCEKLPVRERLSLLCDRHGFLLELSPLA